MSYRTDLKNLKVGIYTTYYWGLCNQYLTFPLSSLPLELLFVAKTCRNGPVLGKISHRIKISLAFCLIFWPFTFICLEIGHWRGKSCLLDHLFILHPCIKHNDLFYYIYVITTFTKCFHEFFCYYSLLLLLKSSKLDLGRHWVNDRDKG